MHKIFYSLRLLIVVILSLAMNACGVLTFSNLLGTNTLGSGATSSAEALDAFETELFDSGTIDIPVSISRLDTPDATLIEVTISDISPDESSSLFATRARPLEALVEDTEYTFTFKGGSGAVPDSATPYVLVSNTQTGDQQVVSVGTTGDFLASLNGKSEQDFILTAMTTSDILTATASPVLVIRANAQGAISISTTNTGPTAPLISNTTIVVSQGVTYFSNRAADGTINFWLRNLNGAQPTLLLSGLVYPIRLVSVFADNSAIFLNDNGAFIMASNIGTPSVSVHTLRGPLETTATADDLFSSMVLLDQFDFTPQDNNDTLPYSLITVPEQGTFIVKQFMNGAEVGIGNGAGIVDFIDTDGLRTVVIPSAETPGAVEFYDDVYADFDSETNLLMVAISEVNSNIYNAYSVDVSENSYPISEAWAHKTLLVSNIANVRGMGANANLMIYSTNTSPTQKELRLVRNGGVPEMILQYDQTNNPYTDIVKISPDGLFAVSCRVDSTELYLIPLANDPVPEPILFATPGICHMKDMFIDDNHRVFFYSTQDLTEPSDEPPPSQLTFIDVNQVPALQEALGL